MNFREWLGRSIKNKMIFEISFLAVVITVLSTIIQIINTRYILLNQLISKSVSIARAVVVTQKNLFASYMFAEIGKTLEEIIKHDKDCTYGYIYSQENYFIIIPIVDTMKFKGKLPKEMAILEHLEFRSLKKIDTDEGTTIEVGFVKMGNEKFLEVRYKFTDILQGATFVLGLSLDSLSVETQRLLWQFLEILIIVLALAYGGTLYISHTLSEPILYLSKIATELSRKNFDININVDRIDEIGILAKTFQQMKETIKEYTNNLERLVEERTKELNIALEELRQRDMMVQKELELARAIQLSIIPKEIPSWKGLKFAGYTQQMEMVGGDIYDVIRGEEELLVYVADISGHGIPSALVSSMLKILFPEAFSKFPTSPSDIAKYLNSFIYHNINSLGNNKLERHIYFTSFIGIMRETLGSGIRMDYVVSGQRSPYLYLSKEKTIKELTSNGALIGILNPLSYVVDMETVLLNPGDKLMIYTDGIAEQENEEGEEFGKEKLKNLFLYACQKFSSPTQILDYILEEFLRFSQHSKIRDDYTLIVITY